MYLIKFVDGAVHIPGYMASNDMTGNEEWIHSDVTTIYNDIIWDTGENYEKSVNNQSAILNLNMGATLVPTTEPTNSVQEIY